ncbi:S-layer homology domain-containing protein, partial [Paenibacillus sp. UNCCL117]|uniref:X2-like carbohydrate binding domain-containing protein n=1 Tax=unclassified Paenibacillus TaxID=185978 RepID=UPI000886C231
EYLATQAVGLVNLTFKFSAGADQTLAVTVSDSTPQNGTINPTTANFDKYATATDYTDVAVSMTLNGNSLASIKNGFTTLVSGTDYTETGSSVTIKKEYLAAQAVGLVNLTFKFNAGADQTLAVTVSDSTPQNSTINPTTANFDKYAAAADYADIAVSMTLNGNSLASIKNGSATLVSGTDYTETGSSVTIKKEYLATQTAGLVNLTFKFSAGADQTLAVTVSDSTPQNSTISPTTANFDKYTAATDYADVAVSMSLNGNSLDSIKNGAATLVSGTDYTESGSSVTIKKEYLATQAVGLVNLTFKFSAGADQTLAVTVSDSTPQNSTINPTTANFDKYAAGTEYANVAVSMTLNGNSLASIKNGAATLVPGTDYTESGSSVTIKKEYLATQGVGLVNLTFKFSAGADQTLAVTVSDSTPQNSTINPTTANFDKYAAGTEYADVAVSMTLNGNSLASIKNGAATLVSSTDYTESGSSVTIKKEYLATQSVGLVNLTFKFSAGADQTLAITVSDSTPQNSTISPTTANFDKYASATDYADVAVSMSLNGNSLDSIKNGSTTLISGTDYTESGSNVTIKKEYLATQAVGLVNLTFKFSAGADQTLAVTLSNSTPQASVPAAPADLRAITGDSQVHLSWTSVVQATYYNIYMSNESGSYGGTPTAAVFGTTSTQTGLINGTTYYFVVKAGNSVGESVYSQEVSAMPTAETLPSLTTVTMVSTNPNAAFAKTGDTVTLTFTADTAMGDIPTATIAGRAVNVSAAGNHTYVAAYTFDGSENEGIIPFTIDFTSVTGIQGAQVTGTTDNRTVLFDKTEPTGSLSVNGGAASTHTASVNLTIMSDDGSGAGSIQMRFSHDNATWSAWEAATLTKAWTLVPGDGSKTVYMQLMDAAGNMTTSIISASIQLQHSYESTSPGGSPSSPTETIPVNVNNGKNGDSWLVSTTIIQRTTDADGRKKDELTFTAQEAAKAVEKLAATGSSLAKIVIPDSNDEVQELKANLPMVAAELLAKANVSLELATHNSRIIIPPASLRGLEHDMYFRIVPIKKESERNEVEQRVKVERLVREVAGSNNVEIIGRPMIIETNMQSREVELVLPLGTATLKETQLKNLGIFVEHSDGTKEWLQGQIVSYDDNEKLGIRFKVNKFSTFTIVHIEGLPKPIHNAYINGYADGTFGANNPITRAEMATILSRVLTNEEKHTALSFTDVTLTHWAKESIDQAAQMGVMNGYPDGSFKPEASITRGEMAAIVVRLVDSVEKSDSGSFRDIDGHWAQAAIEKAKAAGIINGYEDETFRPEQTLTRAEAVTMMNKILGRGPLLGAASNWKDVPEKHWAHAQIQEASLDHQYEKTPNGEKYVPVN